MRSTSLFLTPPITPSDDHFLSFSSSPFFCECLEEQYFCSFTLIRIPQQIRFPFFNLNQHSLKMGVIVFIDFSLNRMSRIRCKLALIHCEIQHIPLSIRHQSASNDTSTVEPVTDHDINSVQCQSVVKTR